MTSYRTIRIRRNDHDEYEVPTARADSPLGPQTSIYFADDRLDAIATARWQHEVVYGYEIVIKVTRGTYDAE